MKARCTRGFGKITDPETGEVYNVERDAVIDVSEAVFQRLDRNYAGMERVEDSNPKGKATETTEEDSAEDTTRLENVTEEHWRTVVSDIEAGEYDTRLDELAEVDARDSVQNAIEERQGE